MSLGVRWRCDPKLWNAMPSLFTRLDSEMNIGDTYHVEPSVNSQDMTEPEVKFLSGNPGSPQPSVSVPTLAPRVFPQRDEQPRPQPAGYP
jgi:hypothetical protein